MMATLGRLSLLALALVLGDACDHGAPAPTRPEPAASSEPAADPPAVVEAPSTVAPGDPPLPALDPDEPPLPRPTVLSGPVKSAKLRARLAHPGWIGALAWSPDGGRLVTGDDTGAIQIWDAQRGEATVSIDKQTRRISAIAFDGAGSRIAAAALDDLRVFRARDGALVRDLVGHGDIIFDVRFDGSALIAVDVRNEHRRWDLASAKPTKILEVPSIHKLSAALDPSGQTLALGGYGDLEVLEVPALRRRFLLDAPNCRDAPKELLCAGWKERQMEEFGHDGGPPSSYKERSPNWYVQSLAYSADGSKLALGRADGIAAVIDVVTGKALARFTVGDDAGAQVALTPDGATLAAGDREGRLALWDLKTRRELVISREPGIIGPLAFSPAADALAAGGPGQAVTIWELRR
ncbi:MAG: hypothetical protein R3B09_13505 [Nannocystaceae bacterium]